MRPIDLNCDLGEGAGHDAGLMPLITSANIACGAHAGDEATMRTTAELAKKHGVAIGAHPGFADRENFGRRERPVTPVEVRRLVLTQTRLLQAVARQCGTHVAHVKAHGALYNMAARDEGLAQAVADAVHEADPKLVLFGLPGSALIKAGQACGLRTANEVFADRTYQADGSLTPRTQPGALITDEGAAVAQVLRMVREGRVRAIDGAEVAIQADTICIHGDGAHPVEFARRLRQELTAAGVALKFPRRMIYLKLIGILVVAAGFAFRFNTLLVVMVAGIATGLVAGMSFNEIMELFGKYFIENRYITLTVVLMLPVVGLLERHGLRERAETLIKKARAATAGRVLIFYTALRQVSVAFGINIGGHAAMVRPLVAPMAEAAAKLQAERAAPPAGGAGLPEQTTEAIRAHAAAAENIGNFFGEDTVFAVGAVLLIQGTLHAQGHDVSLWTLSFWGIPTAFVAFGLLVWRARQLDRRIARDIAAKPEERK